jgi:hypothetical protein
MKELFEKLTALIPENKRAGATEIFNQISDVSKLTVERLLDKAKDPTNIPLFGEFFKGMAGRDEYYKYVGPLFDSKVSAAAEKSKATFIEKELPGMINAEVEKRNPTKSKVELELENLKAEILKKDMESARKDQINLAIKLSEGMFKGFQPERFIGATNEETTANITAVKESFLAAVAAAVKAKDDEWLLKTGGRPSGAQIPDGMKNPFIPGEHFSLQKQGEIFKSDKALYERLLAESKKK